MQNVAVFSPLFEDQHWVFPIAHEADAAIDAVAEIVEQAAQAARKARVVSKAKSSRAAIRSSISCRKIRLVASNSRSCASGESPAAIRSALMKWVQPATCGRYSSAKVV